MQRHQGGFYHYYLDFFFKNCNLHSDFTSRWSLQEMCLEILDPGSSCPLTLGTAFLRLNCLSILACRLCITPRIPMSSWPSVFRWERERFVVHMFCAHLSAKSSLFTHWFHHMILSSHVWCSSCPPSYQAQMVHLVLIATHRDMYNGCTTWTKPNN